MIGCPVSAEEWNERFDIKHGILIAKALEPLHEHPLALGVSQEGLGIKAKEVIVALFCFIRGVYIVDAHCVTAGEWIVRERVDFLWDILVRSYPHLARVELARRSPVRLYNILRSRLLLPQVGAIFRSLDDSPFWNVKDRIADGFGESVCGLVSALILGWRQCAFVYQGVLDCYRAGNYPLGFRRRSMFVMICGSESGNGIGAS